MHRTILYSTLVLGCFDQLSSKMLAVKKKVFDCPVWLATVLETRTKSVYLHGKKVFPVEP